MAVNKQEIEKLLREYFHVDGSYSISETGLVSIAGSVELRKKCEQLPVSFDRINGVFNCVDKELISLVGAPQWVGGDFYCGRNQLTSLVGAPQWVGDRFICWDNQLTSLIGAPRWVGDSMRCYSNQLETLEGAPLRVGNSFICHNNRLTSLVGAPLWIGNKFHCGVNPLTSLKGIPLYIGGDFRLDYNAKLPLCEILTSKIRQIGIDNIHYKLYYIVNRYLNTGYQGIPPFANELIRAGYRDNAWM